MDISELVSRSASNYSPPRAAFSSGLSQTSAGRALAWSGVSEDPADNGANPFAGGLDEAVEEIREFVMPIASDIEFSIDEDSGRTVVKLIDRQTQDIIRQIPSQEMLDLAKALDKLQGLLIRQKA
ncbi:MAG: flagellar protein FlaG [Candidatus Accumulibacter sp.]|jgi:flagellar protein FlaG|nr:flagellar protein FlaG [Accumulibacter sp.]